MQARSAVPHEFLKEASGKRIPGLTWVLLFGIVGAMFLAGCASIFKGTNQSVSVQSTPSAAKVVVTTAPGDAPVFEGTTPAQFSVKKTKEYKVTVKLAGYKPATSMISHDGIETWFIGNLICGGLLGMVIDYADGAMWKLAPNQINVTLQTAYLPNGDKALYAVFVGRDDRGQIRNFAVPMIRDDAPVSTRTQ